MLDVLTASPSVGAWRCDPFSIAEIDAHPDRDRIWATIAAAAAAAGELADRANDGLDVAIEEAREDAIEEAASDVGRAVTRLVNTLTKDGCQPEMIAKVEALRWCLE